MPLSGKKAPPALDRLSLQQAAVEVPDRLALLTPDSGWTFAQLWQRVADEIAEWPHQGVEPGRPLAMVGRNDLASLTKLYAAMELGLSVALLHPRWTVQEQRNWSTVWQAHPLPPGSSPAESILAIVRTSGSSGHPRGVCLSRGACLASAKASEANLGWQDDDRWLLALPVAHVGGLAILLRCLAGRQTVVVAPTEDAATGGAVKGSARHFDAARFDAAATVQLLKSQDITLLSVVPTQLNALLGVAPSAPPSLRAVLVGGAAAAPQLMQRAVDQGWPVLATYGCSEACSQIATQAYGATWTPAVGSGKPLPGQELRIRNQRIEFRGPTLMSGYLPPDDEPFTDDGWLLTGDLGRLEDDGSLHVLGRADDVIISGGENVVPQAVEAVLETHPAVAAACVFGRDDAKWGQRVVAALVLVDDAAKPSDDELKAFVRQRLAAYECPKEVVWVEALRLNAIGKLDRGLTV